MLILILFSSSLLSQTYVDGPANVRSAPGGKKLFSVNDKVQLQLENSTKDWRTITLTCFVKQEYLEQKTSIKANVPLLNYKGDSIGFTYAKFELLDNINKNYWRYDELSLVEVKVQGLTYKNNIRDGLTKAELKESHKNSYEDSCENTFFQYTEENGLTVTEKTSCSIYSASFELAEERTYGVVKTINKTTTFSGAEGQESEISMEIKSPEGKYKSINLSFLADNAWVEGPVVRTVKYGCCAAPNEYKLYNIKTQQQVLSYQDYLYEIEIPNSRLLHGYVGYTQGNYYKDNDGRMIVGTVEFSDGHRLLHRIRLETQDEKLFKSISRLGTELEFITQDPKDKIEKEGKLLRLWSKDYTKNRTDLFNFKLKVKLYDDSTGTPYEPEILFKNGQVNGMEQKELVIRID